MLASVDLGIARIFFEGSSKKCALFLKKVDDLFLVVIPQNC